MRESPRVNVVDALEDLLEVVLGDGFIKGARVRDVFEELAAGNHLLNDIRYLHLLAIFLYHRRVLFELEVLDHVLVLERGGRLDFLLEQSESTRVECWVVEAEYLQGILATIRGST